MVCVRKGARLAPSLKGWLYPNRGDSTDNFSFWVGLGTREPGAKVKDAAGCSPHQWVRTDESYWNSCHLWKKKSTLKCDLARANTRRLPWNVAEDLLTPKGGWAAEPWSIRFRARRAAGNLGARAGYFPLPATRPSLALRPLLLYLLEYVYLYLHLYFLLSFSLVFTMNGAEMQKQLKRIDFLTSSVSCSVIQLFTTPWTVVLWPHGP